VKLAQLGPGLDPDLFHERLSGLPVRLEGLGLSTAAVKRQHLEAAQALAERMLLDQRVELGDDRGVAADGEVRIDSVLERRHP
jgi:hypothetical protein